MHCHIFESAARRRMTTTNLSERSLGWLRYLYRKARTPDDWSREGHPHPHWDDRTQEPMRSWHRFDLVESSYALGLMARTTPAWREVYVDILDELIERHTCWWSAADWLTQFGRGARRSSCGGSPALGLGSFPREASRTSRPSTRVRGASWPPRPSRPGLEPSA